MFALVSVASENTGKEYSILGKHVGWIITFLPAETPERWLSVELMRFRDLKLNPTVRGELQLLTCFTAFVLKNAHWEAKFGD